jgi:hypothetical protein
MLVYLIRSVKGPWLMRGGEKCQGPHMRRNCFCQQIQMALQHLTTPEIGLVSVWRLDVFEVELEVLIALAGLFDPQLGDEKFILDGGECVVLT